MKKQKIIFWVTTGILFIFEGLIPLFTAQSETAKAGIAHLGYPAYFGLLLAAFKVKGSFGLILPIVKGRLKEWIYAGFAFDFFFAFASLLIVDGFTPILIVPLICMVLLILSYRAYHRLQQMPQTV